MNLKVKGLVLAVVSALVLNGCDSDSAKEKIEAGVHHVKDVIQETGDRVDAEFHRTDDNLKEGVKHVQQEVQTHAAKELSDSEITKNLEKIGMQDSDIATVLKNDHFDAAMVAVDVEHDVFYGTTYDFADKGNASWLQYDPNQEGQKKIGQLFGRVAFVINSPKFQKMFTANAKYLDSTYFYETPSVYTLAIHDVPDDYAQYKQAILDTLQREHNQYTFYVSTSNSGNARGDVGHLNVYFHPTQIAGSAQKANGPLLIHEFSHTFGYRHVGDNSQPAFQGNPVQMQPNNVPYLVHLITERGATSDSYQGDMRMLSDSMSAKTWHGSDSLFTHYFGDN
ncbi:hypothetical protein AB4624_06725 [Vibrio breoganii]